MMARSLLDGWDEMTNKATPDDSVRHADTDSDRNDGGEANRGTVAQTAKAASPLIAAIEIENFKGIGRPMRVDLRPITLLFGNNSAGKSTVLHALCYAHEILSHRNVDAHKTERGGDRIDLGGYHNFIHAHEPTNPITLHFELNMERWETPEPLVEKLGFEFAHTGVDIELSELEAQIMSGWVKLKTELRGDQPLVASYEVGVNGMFVGCIQVGQHETLTLKVDPTHPLLVGRQTGPVSVDQRLGVEVLGRASALPRWGEPLLLTGRELENNVDDDHKVEFYTRVSILFAGIGQSLCDELARLRYIGPVRDIDPQTRIESTAPNRTRQAEAVADFISGRAATPEPQWSSPAPWADGSTAWVRLHDTSNRDLIDEVSDWLAGKDRLDTGYALQARSLLTIREEDAELVPRLREYHRLREQFGNTEGSVNLNQWAQEQAKHIVVDVKQQIHVATRACSEIRKQFARVVGADYFDEEIQEAARGMAMVDRYLQYLLESSSVDAIATRIEKPRVDGMPVSPEWTPEDTGRLVRIVARMNGRNKHRDEIRKFKAATEVSRVEAAGRKPRTESAVATPHATGIINTDQLAVEEDKCERERMLAAFKNWLNQLSKDVPELHDQIVTSALWAAQDAKNEAIRRWFHSDKSIEAAAVLLLDLYAGSVNPRTVEERIPFIEEIPLRVDRARTKHRRVSKLVAKVESRDFTSTEVNKLAAAIAGPPQRELQLVSSKTGLPVRPSDVGTGISQILPVVVAALDPDRPGITAIEQPELHLHPRIQVELGDLFTQQIDKGGIFLIETHSEHLLLRFMKRMRQTNDGALPDGAPEVRPENIAVYFVEIDPDGEQTLIREMPLNERGDLVEAWPGGFFEEDLREIF